VIASLTVAILAVAGDPPQACLRADHDCLTTGSVGCTDAACCELVCGGDPFCCTTAWDSLCVGEALSLCAVESACGESAHPCDVVGFPACNDVTCCEAVCAVLPDCCEAAWDGDCVLQAFALCRLPSPPTYCTTSLHGCGESGGPGCNDDACCAAVCASSPTCCAVAWDSACIETAIDLCGIALPPFCDDGAPRGAVAEPEPCGTSVNDGCNVGADSGSSCCVPDGPPSCDDRLCMNVVCSVDPFCCMVAWDQICADESIALCPETCAVANPPTTPIAIGVPVCGYVTTSPSFDHDWYALTLAEKAEVVVTLTSTKPLTFGIGDTDGIADCALGVELDPVATSASSLPTSITACLEPGTHWIVVKPSSGAGTITCAGGGEYLLDVAAGAPTCVLPDPVNETCATAIEIFEGSTPVTTRDAATDPSPAPKECGGHTADFPITRDVWFRFVAPRDGTVRVDTCGTCTFAARLVAYAGTCDRLVVVACSEGAPACPLDDPGFDLEVVGGESYFLQLGSRIYGTDGDATLSIGYYRCDAPYVPTVLVPSAPYDSSKATGLSDDGQLVGSLGIGASQHAMTWTADAGIVVLSTSLVVTARDVNDAGLVVGTISNLPATWFNGAFTQLPGLGTCLQGSARAINESGTVAGALTQSGCPATVVTWQGNAITPTVAPPAAKEPVAITERGAIAGWGATGFDFTTMKGWLLEGSTFTWIDPPSPNVGLQFLGMNDAHEVAGRLVLSVSGSGGTFKPILWKDGAFTDVEVPDGFLGGRVSDINNLGVACGAWDESTSGSTKRRAFVVAPNGHAVPLDLLMPPDLGYLVQDAMAINDVGQIAANLRLPGAPVSMTYAAILTPSAPTGDLDCDRTVDGSDLAILLGAWGPCPTNATCNADFTLDGTVDGADLAVLLGGWGSLTP
jgi:uncharacterized membrane protein